MTCNIKLNCHVEMCICGVLRDFSLIITNAEIITKHFHHSSQYPLLTFSLIIIKTTLSPISSLLHSVLISVSNPSISWSALTFLYHEAPPPSPQWFIREQEMDHDYSNSPRYSIINQVKCPGKWIQIVIKRATQIHFNYTQRVPLYIECNVEWETSRDWINLLCRSSVFM